jgi:hypothetical protein
MYVFNHVKYFYIENTKDFFISNTSNSNFLFFFPHSAIVKRRLVTNESVTASLGPKRIASDFFSFATAAKRACSGSTATNSNNSTSSSSSSIKQSNIKDEKELQNDESLVNFEDNKSLVSIAVKSHEHLLATLMTFDFSARRLPALAQRCALDEAYYAKAQRLLGEQISSAHSDLERLKEELETARQMQTQRALYERLAKGVLNKHAPRDQLNALLVAAEKDYASAVEESRALDAKMELRVSQFMPVLSSVLNLEEELIEEAKEETRKRIELAALKIESESSEEVMNAVDSNRSREDASGGSVIASTHVRKPTMTEQEDEGVTNSSVVGDAQDTTMTETTGETIVLETTQ